MSAVARGTDGVRQKVHETKSDDALSKRGSATSAALLTYGTNLSVSALSLANVLIVSRVLGPGARGQVAFLITVATMSAQIGGLSVQEANANIGGSEPQVRARLATNSLLVALVCGIATAAIIVALS